MESLSSITTLLFTFSALLALGLFYLATKQVKPLMVVALALFIIQGFAGYAGFYNDFTAMPPRFVFLVAPSLLLVAAFFLHPRLKTHVTQLEMGWLFLISIIRVPVELGLYSLHQAGLIPEMMTFSGFNFDIFSGITAPFAWWIWQKKGMQAKNLLLAWNTVCLVLLLVIVITAIGAAPLPFQAWAFDQPNIGVVQFPVQWLPGLIVPIVLFSHIALFKRLLSTKP